jgi:hypothetical protein
MIEARFTSSTLRVDTMAVPKQAKEAAEKASVRSNHSIKVKLHLSLKKATLKKLV